VSLVNPRLAPDHLDYVVAHRHWVPGDLEPGDTKDLGIDILHYRLPKSQLPGCQYRIEIIPEGKDKWDFDLILVFHFSDDTQRTHKHGYQKLGTYDNWPHYTMGTLQ
jgi:hypothetical protein